MDWTKEMRLEHLLALMTAKHWVLMTELRLVQLMERDLEHLKETLKEMSLVCSSAEWMVIQKVLMMGSCWVEMLELCLDQPTGNWMEMSLVC